MAELIWEGKYDDRGRKVAPPRIALPFQTVETVNESAADRDRNQDLFATGRPTDWRNRLIWGDKKYILPSLLEAFAGKVDLIYIDPPFDTGANFTYTATIPDDPDKDGDQGATFVKEPSLIEQKAYRDTWGHDLDSYARWFYETAVLLRELLTDRGSLYVHLDENVGHYVKTILDEVFHRDCFQREIIWRIGWISGYKSVAANWIRNHDSILFYTKNPKDSVFNKQYIPYPADYVRRDGKKPEGKGYPIDDVWNGSPMDPLDSIQIMSFSGEKVGYPTQKNEGLVKRILTTSSNEGDLILDCFCGSGTTAAVAEKLNRRWIACDLGRFAIHTTRKRLLGIPAVKPFVVQNLGKYERQAWQVAEFGEAAQAATDRYRRFVLSLYHAQPVAGYVWLHGSKAGRMVHVGGVDAPVTRADVSGIVTEFRKAVGSGKDAPQRSGIDVLGWDFAFELNETARQEAELAGINLRLIRIPREVLEKKAVEQGDIKFFELAALSVGINKKARTVTLKLTDFMIPLDDVPEEVQKAVTHWEQWIDYWAVDWNNSDDTFHNEWQSYRTRKDSTLARETSHTYDEAGKYRIVVKVIDILGNDTTRLIQVEVK